MPKVLLYTDASLPLALSDVLTRWTAQVQSEGWTVSQEVAPAGMTAVQAVKRVSVLNPDAVFLVGDVPIPMCGPIIPDGHYARMYPSDAPYACPGPWRVASGLYSDGSVPGPVTRKVGRLYFEKIAGIDKAAEYRAYFERDIAARTERKQYEKRAYCIDHLANVGAWGATAKSLAVKGLGAENVFGGLPAHDPGGVTDGKEYWLELEGHAWTLFCDYSGGYGMGLYSDGVNEWGAGEFYTGNTPELALVKHGSASPLARPDVAFVAVMGSFIGEFTRPDAYAPAWCLAALGCIHCTDTGRRDAPNFDLLPTTPFPEIARQFQDSGQSLAYTYFGDPTMPLLMFGSTTIGADTLSSTEATRLDAAIAELKKITDAATATMQQQSVILQTLGGTMTTLIGRVDKLASAAPSPSTAPPVTSTGDPTVTTGPPSGTGGGTPQPPFPQPSTPPPTSTPIQPQVQPPTSVGPVPQFADRSFEAVGKRMQWAGIFLPGPAWTASNGVGGNAFVDATGGAVDLATPPDGTHVCELEMGGWIEQSVSGFTPGQSVTLTAKVAYRKGYEAGSVGVLLDGSPIGDMKPFGNAQTGYTERSVTFTPSAASHTIRFAKAGNGVCLIDNPRLA